MGASLAGTAATKHMCVCVCALARVSVKERERKREREGKLLVCKDTGRLQVGNHGNFQILGSVTGQCDWSLTRVPVCSFFSSSCTL